MMLNEIAARKAVARMTVEQFIIDCEAKGTVPFISAWGALVASLDLTVSANDVSIHTISHGRWQGFVSVWDRDAKDYYRVSRIANDPGEAIFLTLRDLMAHISPLLD